MDTSGCHSDTNTNRISYYTARVLLRHLVIHRLLLQVTISTTRRIEVQDSFDLADLGGQLLLLFLQLCNLIAWGV